MRRRVVVTGAGAVTPIGLTVAEMWAGLMEGRSGIGPITRFDTTGFTTRIAGELKGFRPEDWMEAKEVRRNDLFVQYAMAAATQAVADAGLEAAKVDATRFGVLVGSGIGGITTWESQHKILLERGPDRVSPFFVPMMIVNMAAGQLSIRFGARGPNFAPVSACTTGAHAVGESFRMIQDDEADVMLAGGSEAAITPLSMAGFCTMKALSTRNDDPARASRPFDAERDGFVMGEGAGLVVLEEMGHALRRGARIYGELAGYGLTADAHHITAPSPDGEGAARAMELAIVDAGVARESVGYINAHGTSTPLNDKFETMAVKSVFGEHARRLALGSTKSMTGHLLGAAGGLEFIITVLSVQKGILPPTMNYEHPDPECDLDCIPNKAREQQVEVALSNSLGFGGHNAALAVRRFVE
jgi:3-oxoacyl-[acyl-carrier-protein] synthase II